MVMVIKLPLLVLEQQYYANANLDTIQDLDAGLLFGNLLNYKVKFKSVI